MLYEVLAVWCALDVVRDDGDDLATTNGRGWGRTSKRNRLILSYRMREIQRQRGRRVSRVFEVILWFEVQYYDR